MKKDKDQDKALLEDQCYKAVEKALGECQGKSREFTIKALKAAYPFGIDRTGRKYKIWNRIYNHAIDCLDAGAVKYA